MSMNIQEKITNTTDNVISIHNDNSSLENEQSESQFQLRNGAILIQHPIQKVDAIVLSSCILPPANKSKSVNTFETFLLAEKFLILEPIEGSSLCRCVNINTQQEFICKIIQRGELGRNLIWAHHQMANYPRINKLTEVLMNNQYLYLVFAKAHGDLHSYVREKKRLQEKEAKSLFKQISETVKKCHQKNIVLRDLKLRKFVFSNSQRTELKLESLEESVIVENGINGDLLQDKYGCPSYCSPEILKTGVYYSGKAADMWSLGVILYTMLVGRYPFNDSEHVSLFMKITRCHFVIPDCVSFRAKSLIRSLLKRDPFERLLSDDILYHPWFNDHDHSMKIIDSKSYDHIVLGSSNSESSDDTDDNDIPR